MEEEFQDTAQLIGSLNEKPLHAALKAWYAQPGDRLEVPVDGFVIDIVHPHEAGRDLLVEIQTAGFSALKRKLANLVQRHRVRLVYPVAREKWIVRLDSDLKTRLGRRKSPKRGHVRDVFAELVSFPTLISSPNFTLEVLLIQEEELRRHDRRRAWRRRGWVTHERHLLCVLERVPLRNPADMAALLPEGLDDPFTTAQLAAAIGRRRRLGQQMAYCLREMGAIDVVGKRGNAILYTRSTGACSTEAYSKGGESCQPNPLKKP